MERSLPPSARRLALARRAGAVLTSPAAVAALALAGGLAAAWAALDVTVSTLVGRAQDGWATAASGDPVARALAVDGGALAGQSLGLAAPILVTAAGAALVATAMLARGLVVPGRAIRGAPQLGDDAGDRALDALVGVLRLAIVAAALVGFVIARLPAIAALAAGPGASVGGAARGLVGAALAQLAIAAIVASGLEVALRSQRRQAALRMTVREARDERRETEADPGLRRQLRAARGGSVRDRIAGAIVVVVDDERAVAIGWRPGHEPEVIAVGRGVTARALRTAARGQRVPMAIAPALATRLIAPGPVPAGEQAALASLFAGLGLGPR